MRPMVVYSMNPDDASRDGQQNKSWGYFEVFDRDNPDDHTCSYFSPDKEDLTVAVFATFPCDDGTELVYVEADDAQDVELVVDRWYEEHTNEVIA